MLSSSNSDCKGREITPFRLVVKRKNPVTSLYKGNGELPIYFVHDIFGGCGGCDLLANELGESQTFYKIEADRGEMSRYSSSSIEEIALLYTEKILDTLPKGPVILMGYSAGAILALAIAQHLHVTASVHCLIAIDGAPQKEVLRRPLAVRIIRQAKALTHWLSYQIAECQNIHTIFRKIAKRYRLVSTARYIDASYASYSEYKIVNEILSRPIPESIKVHIAGLFKKLCAYSPDNYKGRVLVFESKVTSPVICNSISDRWRACCNDVQSMAINGRHCDVWRAKNIAEIANGVKNALLYDPIA